MCSYVYIYMINTKELLTAPDATQQECIYICIHIHVEICIHANIHIYGIYIFMNTY
jgi:hypothetical protein